MKLLSFKTIRIRLTTWFLILALAPLFIGILITYYHERKSIELENFNKLAAIRDLKVQQLESWLDERIGDLHVMSGDAEIRGLENIFDITNKSPNDLDKLEIAKKLLFRNQLQYDSYEEIFIIGANTKLIEISSNSNFVGDNKSNDLYFTVPLETGETYIKDIYYSRNLGRPQMTISMPVFCLKHTNHIVGIIVARINLEKTLYKLLLNKVGLGETGETLIVNKDVIALNELRSRKDAVLNLKINAEPAVEAAAGKTGITKTLDYQGKEVLAAYTYIPQTGWGFISKQDLSELNIPIRALVLTLLILFIISALIIVILVFWISEKISKPIVDLDIAANKIRGGDYSVRTVVDSKDELASLANSINEMTASIESRIDTQKGVADISDTMIGQSSLQQFGSELLKQLMKITDANMSTFYILNEATKQYEHFSSVGVNEKLLSPFSADNPEGEVGNAISRKRIYYLRDIPENTIFNYKTSAGNAIPREIITIPILVDNNVVAIISLVNIHSFGKECYDILEQSWAGINVSYSNLIAGERTRIFADQLSRSNQQLEAQTEELQEQTEELQEQSEELQNQTEELQRTSEELQEQNLELEAQRKQVETASKMKSEFLSNMSHELRTPLNSIMALSRVLISQSSSKLTDEENNYLEIVERNGKRLLALINDILDLSKIEAGKMEIVLEFISITPLLNIIKDNLSQLADEKGLSITLKLANDLPKIETEESKLQQILTNIIGNAVKFTKKGSVDIAVSNDAENIFIEVKDSGIGISDDELPHIFDEFRQADGSSSRPYEGTGLGLAIANKLTQILGGSIRVKSKLGKGSVFTIILPIKWHEDILLTETPSIKDELSKSIDSITLLQNNDVKIIEGISETRILIVEDNQDAIIQVKSVLEKESYTVDVAGGGQEALDYLEHTIPDGIILDLMMPEIDGFEVMEKLKSTKKTKDIPVLVLTAKDLSKKDLAKLSANNIQQLIHKGDVDIEGLILKVKLMLRQEPKIPSSKFQVLGLKDKEENLRSKTSNQKPETSNLKPEVLIVEDNPDNMITIKAILKEGFSVTEAVDGERALKMIQTQLPDIILLDMSLPKVSGKEIVKILKENNVTKEIPIIAVTAQAMKGDSEKFINAGCDDYVSKPINAELLIKKIRKHLG